MFKKIQFNIRIRIFEKVLKCYKYESTVCLIKAPADCTLQMLVMQLSVCTAGHNSCLPKCAMTSF